MRNFLKIAALTAFTVVAVGSVAEANPHHSKHQSSNKGSSHHSSFQSHHSSSHHHHPKPSKHVNVGSHHHKPHHWHHHHHRHHERSYAYSYYKPYGYRDYSYERPSYPTYAPQPSYATYSPPPAAPAPAASCLTKEYLKDGPVLFKDTCTKEWAIGEASEAQSVNANCLRKEYVGDGKVKFSDVCTKEWAMNPPEDAQPNGPRPQQATAEEDDDEN